ncbi:MAG TPA: condensation domain-containing protein [Blastocatellia bacterium]|jgi:L-ascorbate metabolism protein UlaG (beta-lactamase superfamily)|nr:condensation domain-containing protein [Blastocatellia bacterium]
MSDKKAYRLSKSTAAEPLVNRWVAWAHLISPVAYSLHLKNYQLGMLDSYLADPKVHVRACMDPKLRSGSFVEIQEERAGDLREFMSATIASHSDNLELAKNLFDFHDYLIKEANGQSLEPYYERLPQGLRGFVELLYDYYNRPIVRFMEGLLYRSAYYKKDLQSLSLFHQERDNSRPFFLNTPRLPVGDRIEWRVPFDSPCIDDLFELDCRPRPLGHIRELLGLGPGSDRLLMSLLSDAPARKYEEWKGKEARIRYLGHACLLIEYNGVTMLTDPCVGTDPGGGGMERMSYPDLPDRIDYALVTHNHQDHFHIETLLRLRHRIGCLVVPKSFGIFYGDVSLKMIAEKIGFKQVVEMDTLGSIRLPDAEITAVPFMGEHADLPHGKTGYVIRLGGQQILVAADSDCLDRRVYEQVRRALGPIETVFIGMECVGAPLSWCCGPFFPAKPDFGHEQTRRYKGCDSIRALEILEAIDAKRVYVYAMGMEPWFEYLLGLAYTQDAPQIVEAQKLIDTARARGLEEASLLFGRSDILLDPAASEPRPTAGLNGAKYTGSQSHAERAPSTQVLKYRPASSMQRELWGSAQNALAGRQDYVQATWHLNGPLDVRAIEGGINEVIARQEALRTRFISSDTGPLQLIEPAFCLSAPLVDLSDLPEPRRPHLISSLASQQARLPFDLSRLPLLRALIVRLGHDDHLLVVTLHHIICDGWSMGIFIRETVASYSALKAGRKPEFMPLPVQYGDYAVWEQEWMRSEEAGRQLDYWKTRAGAKRQRLWLGGAKESRASESGVKERVGKGVRRGGSVEFEIGEQETRALRQMSRNEGVTMYMSLLGAYQVLLHRVSGADRILVGSPVANRRREEVEGVIGCFINTVEMSVEMGGNPSFREVLRRVRQEAMGAYENQEVSYERVVEESDRRARGGAEGGIQVWFTMQNVPGAGVEMGGVRVREEGIEIERAQFELAMVIVEGSEKLRGRLIYEEGKVEREEVEQMVEVYKRVIGEGVRDMERGILDLEVGEAKGRAEAEAEAEAGEGIDSLIPSSPLPQFMFD